MVTPGRGNRDVNGEGYGKYPVILGLAKESIFCCEATESKGLCKVGGR